MTPRILQFWRRSRTMIRRDIDAELQFHLDARTDALVREGATRDEARARALREFGDIEDARSTSGGLTPTSNIGGGGGIS